MTVLMVEVPGSTFLTFTMLLLDAVVLYLYIVGSLLCRSSGGLYLLIFGSISQNLTLGQILAGQLKLWLTNNMNHETLVVTIL